MSAVQPGPRARHADQLSATPASTSGGGSRPNLPRAGAGPSPSPGRPARTPQPALTLPPLTGDRYDWMALRRVSGGGIAKMGEHWLEHGHRIPGYIADTLAVLCGNGLVALAELDTWSMRRAALTCTGTARYQQLCRQRQTARRVPTTDSAPGVSWLADHPRARTVVQSVWDRLAELEQSGHHPSTIAALKRILADHRPTPAGRCRACRRFRWRRRRFPCIVWHQIRTELR